MTPAPGRHHNGYRDAAAHGDDPAVLKATEAALDPLLDHTRLIYDDFIESKLSESAPLMWEELMATGAYEWQSDFARKYVGQGRKEGREEGQLLAKHEVLLRLLERRGVALSEDDRSRINACENLDQLDHWFDRAITATTAEELFD